MKKSHMILLEQAVDLGQVVLNVHEDLQRWRETPLTSIERTSLSVKLTGALSRQREMLDAIIDEVEPEGD